MFDFLINNISHLNSSKFFAGVLILFMNIGSKYIKIELTPIQRKYLESTFARQVLIFAITFSSTRDIFKALVLTAVFNILASHLFHEESPYCIIPDKWKKLEKAVDTNKDGKISQKEIDAAIKTLESAQQQNMYNNYPLHW